LFKAIPSYSASLYNLLGGVFICFCTFSCKPFSSSLALLLLMKTKKRGQGLSVLQDSTSTKKRGQSAAILEYAAAYFTAAVATGIVYILMSYAQSPTK